MNNTIRRKLMMIIGMCYEISTKTNAQVFFEYLPHTECLEIRGYKQGWEYEKFIDYRVRVFDFNNDQLDKIIKDLQVFWEEVKND